MTIFIRLTLVISVLIALPLLADDRAPTTQPALNLRDRINGAITVVGRDSFPRSNLHKEEDDEYAALRGATLESLQKPTVIGAYYGPQYPKNGSVPVFFDWIEDKPTLHEVIVRNPETGKEQRIQIPQAHLDEARAHDSDRSVMCRWMGQVSLELTGNDPSQVLEIRAPDQKVPANCYPSIQAVDNKTKSTTQPGTGGMGPEQNPLPWGGQP